MPTNHLFKIDTLWPGNPLKWFVLPFLSFPLADISNADVERMEHRFKPFNLFGCGKPVIYL